MGHTFGGLRQITLEKLLIDVPCGVEVDNLGQSRLNTQLLDYKRRVMLTESLLGDLFRMPSSWVALSTCETDIALAKRDG